jgi:glycosyltransferase involved in cell wall biosynthesis
MGESVDILLPTHRRAHTLAYAIRSVLAQGHAEFRLHVVGDGCDGATESMVRSFEDPRVAFYRFPKAPGYGYGHRNDVLRRSSAPFVAYMTDDDLWFPDHLEQALDALQQSRLGLVAFRSCHVRFPGELDPFFFAFDWQSGRLSAFLRNWFMGSVNCVHRRDIFDQVGYWNDRLYRFGDRDFYNRVRRSSVPCEYRDCCTVLRFYAQHWDHRYASLAEGPPQKRYLDKLSDAAWRQAIREAAATCGRPLGVRKRQCLDFLLFGIRSGPKFVRFWLQKTTSHGPSEVPHVSRSEEGSPTHYE